MTTLVANLKTGEIVYYSLPPREAVKAAYLQFDLENFHTWEYDKIEVEYIESDTTVMVGDWCALKTDKLN